jgi:hypothetical protein
MSIQDLDRALVQGYLDMNLGLDTAYDNVKMTPPEDGSDWARLTMVPAVISPSSLGAGGRDLHSGFMQIDFNLSHNTGRNGFLVYADTVRQQFVTGKGFTYDGTTVRITSVDRSNVRTVDGYARMSVTINWESEETRPTII